MSPSVRGLTLAGAVLVGVGVGVGGVAATPQPPALLDAKVEAAAREALVQLSANSIAYIPANIVQTLANIPAVEYQALNQTTEALNKSGNWWLYIPTNVVGFDQQDLEKVQALTLLMMPVPQVAAALADQLSLVLAAEAPMTPDCTGVPGPCTDPIYFHEYFQVPVWQLLTGYTFSEDLVNPIDPVDPSVQPSWAGQTWTLDPLGPAKALWNTLTQEPADSTLPAPTPQEWATALDAAATATWNSLNPFVPGTYCLPCQVVVPGAPDSLPKFPLFGRYYTLFDLGQELTDQDWVGGPAPDPATGVNNADNVPVYNFWSPDSWAQIYDDAQSEGADWINSFPNIPDSAKPDLDLAAQRLTETVQNVARQLDPAGNVAGVQAVVKSVQELAAQVQSAVLAPVRNTPSSERDAATPIEAASDQQRVKAFSSLPALGSKPDSPATVENNAVDTAKALFSGVRPRDKSGAAAPLDTAPDKMRGQRPDDTSAAPGPTKPKRPGGPLRDSLRDVSDQMGKSAAKIADGLKPDKSRVPSKAGNAPDKPDTKDNTKDNAKDNTKESEKGNTGKHSKDSESKK